MMVDFICVKVSFVLVVMDLFFMCVIVGIIMIVVFININILMILSLKRMIRICMSSEDFFFVVWLLDMGFF